MEPQDSEFLRHEACPSCPSSDAFARYSDLHGYCFSCGYREPPDFEPPATTTTTSQSRSRIQLEGEITAIPSRNLTEPSIKKFNVRFDFTSGVVRFPICDESNQVIAYKERNEKKEFKQVGKNPDKRLFGQSLFGGGKTLVITEGEWDCISTFQARPNWPVMSITSGCKGAKSQLSAQLKDLLKFKEIILLFDNDQPGQEAAQECASLFPPDQVFIANLSGYKDASEALQAKDAEAIRQAIWNKKAYSPKAIIDARSLFDLVSKPLHGKDADWPFPTLNEVTGGLRLGELVCLTSGTGSGKSTATGEVAQSLIDQGFTVAYIALEESVQRTALRLMTVKANKPLHLNNEIPEDELRKAFDATCGTGRLYLRSGFGSVNPDDLISDIRFVVKNYGAKWVIIDHLSILLSGNEMDDERRTIDKVVTRLRSFVEECGIGMIMISHLRRNHGDKGHEDGAAISLGQLRGSHSIAQLCDICCCIQRNISSGNNTAELVTLKNRFNGRTGPSGVLSYSPDTGRLVEIKSTEPTNSDSYEDF
jgi:twinkle protein